MIASPTNSREAEIAQGLRDPGGALIGGLDAIEYGQGYEDAMNRVEPPQVTTTSYDLGRALYWRRQEKGAEVRARIDAESARRDAAVRDLLKDHPEALAEYDARMAEIAATYKSA
jgi:hypothetical protein